jgi:hypothetical protein
MARAYCHELAIKDEIVISLFIKKCRSFWSTKKVDTKDHLGRILLRMDAGVR